MADIIIKKASKEELEKMGATSWPIWEKEASKFDWHYDDKETCYLLEGDVTVTAKDGKSVTFGAGDLVVFPRGLDCVWHIKKAVRKHYNFG
ncbi:MAG: cupin domain-containing protein [Candidatus Omnitrophica bacterium]|nr:cupin domain-containing protein [Candidatus Omnitrophota bacterium]